MTKNPKRIRHAGLACLSLVMLSSALPACAGNAKRESASERGAAAKADIELTPASEPAPHPSWDSPDNFSALRDEYGRRADFHQICETDRPSESISKAFDADDFDAAAALALQWLDRCPVDAEAHWWASGALDKAGKQSEADLHWAWFAGLTDAALSSGDGSKPATAIVTISIAEEYAVLKRLRMTPVNQALVPSPTMLDKLTVTNSRGELQIVYFNPLLHFVRLRATLKESQPSP